MVELILLTIVFFFAFASVSDHQRWTTNA